MLCLFNRTILTNGILHSLRKLQCRRLLTYYMYYAYQRNTNIFPIIRTYVLCSYSNK